MSTRVSAAIFVFAMAAAIVGVMRAAGGSRGAAGAVGIEAAERRRARHDSDGRARQQHVVRLARRGADGSVAGA